MVRKLVRKLTRGLLLREDIFYFRIDVRVSKHKYKSIRRSLRTSDFYTAIQRAEQMKHLVRTFSELTSEEQVEFIKFYTRGSNILTDEEKKELEVGDTTSIICAALDTWIASNLDTGTVADRFVKGAVEFGLADTGYPDSAYERHQAKRSAARDIIDAQYIMAMRKQSNPAEEQDFNEILDMAELWSARRILGRISGA